ncbi:glycosyltransferase family 2 protein [Winogradskyella ursingii]|uniref:glycosyltransferase family 2 protein n=1 Tax=Winogradskyella ursingii TaxID=2686079 RepID=UPI0015CD0731|nr:glycosyltransferase family 2 protein [Winogradskyella ursingii]
MDVSIIFVNYNTCKLTCDAIASVYHFTKDIKFEIIVSDNGSVDGSVTIINQKFPEVIIIENNANLGFGKGNNRGVEVAKGKYLFFLNTDTYLLNNAIKILYNYMELKVNKNVAVCGAQLYKQDLAQNISAGNFPSYRLFIKGSFWKHFYPKNYYVNAKLNTINIMDDQPYEVDYVSGADFFVRKKTLDKVGGFDPRFFMYAEDVELSYRIKKTFPESKNMIVPDAKIVHISQGSSKTNSLNKRFRYRFIKSRTIYYRITEGLLPSILYYITSIKRLYF